MTLRARVILIVSGLVLVGIAAASIIAFGSTRTELVQSVDEFLEARSGELVDGRRSRPGPSRLTGGSRQPFDPDALVQVIDDDGRVTASSGDSLPVDEVDRAVARGGTPVYRTIDVDGVDYRMLTINDRAGGAVQIARDISSSDTVLGGLRLRLIASGALLAAVAGLLGWILMRRTTRPLEELAAAAERVAEQGDLTPLDLGRRDEVGRVANSFDKMLGALSLSEEQQRRLVQDAGHELRTPLTSLRANIELLQRAKELPDDDVDAVLAGLLSEVEELGELFTELVQLASGEDRSSVALERVDLAEIAHDAVERFERRTGRHVTVVAEATELDGNATLLDRAVTNLLANAHKFSSPDTPIEVRVEGRRVSVLDRGPGIDPDDLAHVFDRFFRSDAARASAGSGLGLAIVKQVAERHGGSPRARNRDGGGAEVSFSVA